jgi:hypothetical protein
MSGGGIKRYRIGHIVPRKRYRVGHISLRGVVYRCQGKVEDQNR